MPGTTRALLLPGSAATRIAWRFTYALGATLNVQRAEPVRAVQARIRYGHHSRKLAITGMPRDADLNRLLDAKGRRIVLPRGSGVHPGLLALGVTIPGVTDGASVRDTPPTVRLRWPSVALPWD